MSNIKLISHRGNLYGKDDLLENNPDHIKNLNIDVEVDVWLIDSVLYLGHDFPKTKIELDFFNKTIWAHTKNVEALYFLLSKNIHCFWHQNDDYTITSKNYIWVYPGKTLIKDCIAVLPENLYSKEQLNICSGICSDYIDSYSLYSVG